MKINHPGMENKKTILVGSQRISFPVNSGATFCLPEGIRMNKNGLIWALDSGSLRFLPLLRLCVWGDGRTDSGLLTFCAIPLR